jgi:uroporphyrin-III C-methyltransferase/precorrin-2 dehydrogenase/sirohydrochlorin ferrochelatase
VRFVTGHARDGQLPATLDWAGLADPATSLVFYMARRTAPQIAANLMAAGLDAATPVVAVIDASKPGQSQWSGILRDLPAGIATLDATSPLLIGIGRAFGATAVTHDMIATPVAVAG